MKPSVRYPLFMLVFAFLGFTHLQMWMDGASGSVIGHGVIAIIFAASFVMYGVMWWRS